MEISNEAQDEIILTLTGVERDLDLISATDLTATLDVSDRRPGERIEQLVPNRLKIDLPHGVQLEKIEPASIPLRLELIVERQLEVEPSLEGKLGEGYELQGITLTPQKVRVRGPASHVNALVKASTETISLEGRKESFSMSQTAIDIPDQKVKVLDAMVDIFVEIRPLRQRK
jgi:YbbR domain-containing protein